MSEAEDPGRSAPQREISVEDVRELFGPATPHFALQIRNRINKLIAGLPPEHPARVEGEREIARLELIALDGEYRGAGYQPDERTMPSLSVAPRDAQPQNTEH